MVTAKDLREYLKANLLDNESRYILEVQEKEPEKLKDSLPIALSRILAYATLETLEDVVFALSQQLEEEEAVLKIIIEFIELREE